MAALALTFDDIEEAKKDAESANSLSLANSYQSPTGFADPLRMKRVALIV